MPKLYLVGVTEDRSGLVLSKSARSKGGDSILEIDADVLEAIAEIRRYRSGSPAAHKLSSPALPTRRSETGAGTRLSPREIQDRLRHGESMKSVAKRAGIDEWRIEIYAAPILAEQARIVGEARGQTLNKRGAGPSGVTLGDAVVSNLVDKKLGVSRQEYDAGWSAYETSDGGWVVRFEYVSRGRPQRAEWDYDEHTKTLTAANRLATVLGWRDPKARRRSLRLPDAAPATAVTRKGRARRKATAKRKAAPKKATPKKAAPKKAAPKKAAPKKAAPKKAAPKKVAPKKAAPKKAAPKKAAPKKAAPKRKATPKKAPARRPGPPKKAPTRKAPVKKAPGKRPAPAVPAPKKTAPKKAPARKAPVKKAPTRASASAARSRRASTSGRTTTTRRAGGSSPRATRSPRPGRAPAGDDQATRPFRLLDALLAEEEATNAASDDEALEPPSWVQESARRRSTGGAGGGAAPKAPAARTAPAGGGRRASTGPSIKAQRAGAAASAGGSASDRDVVDLDEYRSVASAEPDEPDDGAAAAPAAPGADEAPRRRGFLRRQRPLRAR